MEIYILKLEYDIMFRDSDEGSCWAGDGTIILGAYTDENQVKNLIKEWQPILTAAEREHVIFPIQPISKKIREQFGFVPNGIDGENLKFAIQSVEVQQSIRERINYACEYDTTKSSDIDALNFLSQKFKD